MFLTNVYRFIHSFFVRYFDAGSLCFLIFYKFDDRNLWKMTEFNGEGKKRISRHPQWLRRKARSFLLASQSKTADELLLFRSDSGTLRSSISATSPHTDKEFASIGDAEECGNSRKTNSILFVKIFSRNISIDFVKIVFVVSIYFAWVLRTFQINRAFKLLVSWFLRLSKLYS